MKNLKITLICICVLLCGIQANAQQWVGNNTTTDPIERYGNVSIGAWWSGARLHVKNTTSGQTATSFRLDHERNSDYTLAMQINVDTDWTKAIEIQNDGANVFMIYGNGVVRAKNILAEDIEVCVDAMTKWPDYVFAKDYKLNSLQEVELYINKNGHLSEIPSAKDVVETGINLVEMDAALLKKIEELTLYIIQQEKRIAELENRVNNN